MHELSKTTQPRLLVPAVRGGRTESLGHKGDWRMNALQSTETRFAALRLVPEHGRNLFEYAA